MTVGSQVKTAMANLRSAQASFETFALQTKDEVAKQIEEALEPRVQQIQEEEPEFKGY
jgi:soluble cytochrome b562